MSAERWVTQTKFFDSSQPPDVCTGNCTEAAIASILGVGLDDVPSLQGLRGGDYWFALEDNIKAMGFHLHRFTGKHIFDGLYLADGPSQRGCGHFVVMRGGKMVHDPHPSRAGLLSIESTWLLIPHDPSVRLESQSARERMDAARYRKLRNLPELCLGVEGIPCIAIPDGPTSGAYVTGDEADAAIDAAQPARGGS